MNFLDTNVFLHYLIDGDPAQDQAAQIIDSIENGNCDVWTTDVHIHEVVYVLASPRVYGLRHSDIAARLRPLLEMRGLKLANKQSCLEALDIFDQYEALDFADALAVADMRREGIDTILSFDHDFDAVEGIIRSQSVVGR